MKVWIEKRNGEILNVNTYTAYEGFDMLGAESGFFQYPFLRDVEITKETPVVGSIQSVKKALQMLGVAAPAPLNVPAELRDWYPATFAHTTFGQLRNEGKRVFAKPLIAHKLFTGQVFESFYNTEALPDDLAVFAAMPVEWIVEYRCFVHRRQLIDIRPYRGDFRLPLEAWVVEDCIRMFKSQPIAYSLDFGIYKQHGRPTGTNALVEANHAFALGAYGLSPVKYARMIADCWYEMVGLGSASSLSA